MTRRDLLRLAGLSSLAIFAPRFGRWYRRGSGLVVPDGPLLWVEIWRDGQCIDRTLHRVIGWDSTTVTIAAPLLLSGDGSGFYEHRVSPVAPWSLHPAGDGRFNPAGVALAAVRFP